MASDETYIRTTIRLLEDTHYALKLRAVLDGTTVQDLTELAVTKELERRNRRDEKRRQRQ